MRDFVTAWNYKESSVTLSFLMTDFCNIVIPSLKNSITRSCVFLLGDNLK